MADDFGFKIGLGKVLAHDAHAEQLHAAHGKDNAGKAASGRV